MHANIFSLLMQSGYWRALALLPQAMALSAAQIAAITDEFCVRLRSADDILVCKWHRSWGRTSKNQNGVSGWATVVRSFKGKLEDNAVKRTATHQHAWHVSLCTVSLPQGTLACLCAMFQYVGHEIFG